MFTEEQLQVYHEEREALRLKVAKDTAEHGTADIEDLRELWTLTTRVVLGIDPPRTVEV
jgi:hypothetical protein